MGLFSKNNKVSALIMDQIKDVEGCLLNFENFMRAAVTPETSRETLRALSIGVEQMEDAADRSLRVMIDSLGNASYLPSTREDLISVASMCDKIANKCEYTARMTILERFSFPENYGTEIMEMISITREQFELLEKSINLLFSKFGELLQDHSILDEICAQESKVDKIEEKLYDLIYGLDMGLAERKQTARFIELIADVSDIIEDIADKIRIMLITRKG